MDVSFNAYGQETVIGVKKHMEWEFFGGLDPHLRHMPKELVLSFLPPIVYERRDVEMAAKQKKAYDEMKKRMIASLENDDKTDMLVTTSPLTKMTRMLQLASSYGEVEVYEEFDKKKQKMVKRQRLIVGDPSCKLDAFMDDIEDFGDESVVVFGVSRQLIELLAKRMDKAKIPYGLITGAQTVEQRQEAMDAFQRGEIQFILCTVAAAGTGITLTKGSIAVFLQRSWSMIDNLQAEARVHRIGSEVHDVVRIIDYVTTDSVEETVSIAIEKKEQNLEKILRSKLLLKRMLEENKIDPSQEQNVAEDLELGELDGEEDE
jgi:SNF2 family DNA or RNA helicase